jgi:hypothetical protein
MATAGISNMKAADHEYVRAANVANTDDKLKVHGGREERTADTKRTEACTACHTRSMDRDHQTRPDPRFARSRRAVRGKRYAKRCSWGSILPGHLLDSFDSFPSALIIYNPPSPRIKSADLFHPWEPSHRLRKLERDYLVDREHPQNKAASCGMLMIYIVHILALRALRLVTWALVTAIAARRVGFFLGSFVLAGMQVPKKTISYKIRSNAFALVFVVAQLGAAVFPEIMGAIAARKRVEVLQL